MKKSNQENNRKKRVPRGLPVKIPVLKDGTSVCTEQGEFLGKSDMFFCPWCRIKLYEYGSKDFGVNNRVCKRCKMIWQICELTSEDYDNINEIEVQK